MILEKKKKIIRVMNLQGSTPTSSHAFTHSNRPLLFFFVQVIIFTKLTTSPLVIQFVGKERALQIVSEYDR
jgi:hypothetical protein